VKTFKRFLSVPRFVLVVLASSAVAALAWIVIRYGWCGCYCADAVECTYQAQEMLVTGDLFPKTWLATNFAHLQVFPLRLAFAFTSSWMLANQIAGLVMLMLTVGALVFLWKRGLRDGSGLLFVLFYLAPASNHFLQQLHTGAFYAQFSLALFVIVALWLSAVRSDRMGAGACLAGFVCVGLMGPRMIAVVILPVALSLILVPLLDGRRPSARTVIASVIALALAGVGVKVYDVIVAPAMGVPPDISCADELLTFVASGDRVFANVRFVIEGVMRLFGFPFTYKMVSPTGVAGMLGFVTTFCFIFGFPAFALAGYRRQCREDRFLLVAAWSSLAITLFILLFGRLAVGDEWNMCVRYVLLPAVFLAIAGSRSCWRHVVNGPTSLCRLLTLALALAFAGNILARTVSNAHCPGERWRDVADQLVRLGQVRGYGTYENAMLTGYYSDRRLQMAHVVVEKNRLSIPGWCASARWYGEDPDVGESFLMLTDEELRRFAPDGLAATALGEPSRRTVVAGFHVLTYDGDIAGTRFGAERGPARRLWGFADQWLKDCFGRMTVEIPAELRGRDCTLILSLESFGERLDVTCCGEVLASTSLGGTSSKSEQRELRLVIPSRLTRTERLGLSFQASNAKSPKERGWGPSRVRLGPMIKDASIVLPTR